MRYEIIQSKPCHKKNCDDFWFSIPKHHILAQQKKKKKKKNKFENHEGLFNDEIEHGVKPIWLLT
jgi:hypothetical protein